MEYINVPLTKDEAIVLFEFLSTLEENMPKFQHPSEEAVLNNILVILEKQLVEPFQIDYGIILTKARNNLELENGSYRHHPDS